MIIRSLLPVKNFLAVTQRLKLCLERICGRQIPITTKYMQRTYGALYATTKTSFGMVLPTNVTFVKKFLVR